MANGSLTVVEVKDGVGHIMMNAPERLNALDLPMVDELEAQLKMFAQNPAVKVVVLSGLGKAFCAGGNMAAFKEALDKENYESIDAIVKAVGGLIQRLLCYEKIIIGAVHGAAVGGGANLMLACDFVVADETIKFSEIFTNIGLATDSGGSYLLSKAIGQIKAKEACLFATMWRASDLEVRGLLTEVVPKGEHVQGALALAERLAKGPIKAYEAVKKQNFAINYSDFTEYMERVETPLVCKAVRSADFKEAVTAFIEKREPKFQGC